MAGRRYPPVALHFVVFIAFSWSPSLMIKGTSPRAGGCPRPGRTACWENRGLLTPRSTDSQAALISLAPGWGQGTQWSRVCCEIHRRSIDWAQVVPNWTSLVAQMVKRLAYNAGDRGSIPGSGRSPGEGNGNSLQYSCLENHIDRGALHTVAWLQSMGSQESDMTKHIVFQLSTCFSIHQFSSLQSLSRVRLFATP